MVEKADKSLLRTIGLILATAVVMGVVAGLTNLWVSKASGAATISIGYVDWMKVKVTNKDYQKASADLRTKLVELQKKLKAEVEGLDQETAAKVQTKYQAELNKAEADLMDPVDQKIESAIKEVAKKEGCEVVLNNSELARPIPQGVMSANRVVLVGGKDLTDAVIKKLEPGTATTTTK